VLETFYMVNAWEYGAVSNVERGLGLRSRSKVAWDRRDRLLLAPTFKVT